jgi:phosphatidylglycerophosphatase A
MTTLRPDLKFLFAHPAHLIAFGFGTGLAPKAPGTVGTLLGLPLFWGVVAVAHDLPNQIILLIATFLLGIWACGRTGRALGVADHGGMVWDEIVAFALVLLFTPAGGLWMRCSACSIS